MLLPPPPSSNWQETDLPQATEAAERRQRSRDKLKARLRSGELESSEVEITFPGRSVAPVSILGAGNLEQMENGFFKTCSRRSCPSNRKPASCL